MRGTKVRATAIAIFLILSTLEVAKANVFGGSNSRISDQKRLYILPINYNQPSRELELRPPGIIRPSNQPETPIKLSQPIGVALVGEPGSLVLRISLSLEGETQSHCYKAELRESVSGETLNITLMNKWNPMLFCNNKQPRKFSGIFYSRKVHLPGNYTVMVNNEKIAEVSYSLESGKAEIKYYPENRSYSLENLNQILLFTEPEEGRS
jgi:hypothetical protein